MALSDSFDDYFIEPLGKHDRAAFCCGVEQLDRYLKQQAGQDARKRVAAPFVLVEKKSGSIAGYYTLSATSIKLAELPIEISKKLPKYPIVPATLLGRLAVDQNHRKKGLGEMLLMDALYRSLKNEIATTAVIVEAKDDDARSFYEHYNFIRFPNYSHRLFLMMETISEMFA
ncbi:GNAT family N-acetyltransferase [Anabaena sp. 4-3]|uniref:GNAT family N-acetyltransferase n=1 Tax=Anabaena sp. 4-3 TaxID=1811979 RepID=UPI00082D9591|nr:GNAT family N-acetyltransferase [Anabaena sp. 4-3]